MVKIIFTGGGTLGHVMPNVYLMEGLPSAEKYYIGASSLDQNAVRHLVQGYYEISTTKFRRNKFWVNFLIPFKLLKSISECKKILKQINPDVVFSKGGYVALPVCLAAKKLHIPIVAHESDFSFGLANKIILRLCDTMCVNFKSLENTDKKVVYTGPIISKQFDNNEVSQNNLHIDNNKKTILIVGGSLGSETINNVIFSCNKELSKQYNIIHITGKGKAKYPSFDNVNIIESSSDMNNLYNLADIVICRSGAGVTAEAYYKRKPMLLIPLENRASRGDQVLNAKYYEGLGVAKILHEHDLTARNLGRAIDDIKERLPEIQNAYVELNQPNGRNKVLEIINSVIKKNK